MAFVAALVALLGLLTASPAAAVDYKFPEPTNYVVDVAGLFSQGAVDVANRELKDYQDRSGRQIAVAVVDYPDVTRDNEAEYANALFREWGVGGADGDDNGVLLLIGTQGGTGNRALKVEVGRDLEGDLTDVQAGDVQRTVQGLLQESQFDAGLMAGQRLIRRELGDETVPADVTAFDPGTGPVSTPIGTPSGGGGGFLLLLFIFLLFLWISSRRKRRRRRRRRWFDDDDHYGGGGGIFPVPIFIGGGGWGGGGFGGGGFGGGGGGGGFGGFGGGDSGGGGAGGGW